MPSADDDRDDFPRRGDNRRRDEEDDFARHPRKKSKSPTWIILIIAGCCLVVCGTPLCIGLLLPAVQKVREAANRMKSSNNLKQIGLAAHNYNDTFDELPGNTYSPEGKPLLSWRVHILPFIEEDNLYKQFKLDEPWDSPNNIRLLQQMPKIYSNPNEPLTTKTYYRGFSSPGAVFDRKLLARKNALEKNGLGDPLPGEKKEARFNLGSFKDSTSNTILVVEAGEAVEWSKPDDLDASPGKPMPPLGGMKWAKNKMQVLMADGSVLMLRTDMPEGTLRALITHSGRETVPENWQD